MFHYAQRIKIIWATGAIVYLLRDLHFGLTKDKAHPFIVRTSLENVEVLDTHFNVNNYKYEPAVKTNLLEGSVKVSHDGISKLTNPGRQAVLNQQTGDLRIADTDTELAVAWKNK